MLSLAVVCALNKGICPDIIGRYTIYRLYMPYLAAVRWYRAIYTELLNTYLEMIYEPT